LTVLFCLTRCFDWGAVVHIVIPRFFSCLPFLIRPREYEEHLARLRSSKKCIHDSYSELTCFQGHDDAIAILLACHLENLHLFGISTVAGNANAERIRDNAARCLYAFAAEEGIKVYTGATKPLIRPSKVSVVVPELQHATNARWTSTTTTTFV
jgi:hypothetical protein